MKKYIKASTDSFQVDGYTFEKTNYYKLIDGAMHRNVAAGLIRENRRPFRVAGKYNVYIDSFPDAALPYSTYYVANKETGDVYTTEVLQYMGTGRRLIKELVNYLKAQ